MQLKEYQQTTLEQLDRWLAALKKARLNSERAASLFEEQGMDIPEELTNHPLAAWNALKKQNLLPTITQDNTPQIPDHIPRSAASGAPIPHACLKVPTGGGKTLLGVAALERVMVGTGFVLWIVPTKAIYEQTIRAFRTREHPYRQRFERMSGGRFKLLQKNDRFTKSDVDSYLCVMMLMLPSANRQRNRDFLKIFRDSGGYTSFFPEQDDSNANAELATEHHDLERHESGRWVKQSLFNVLKMVRPTVILDEAHKAYGPNDANNREFVQSVNRLNPRLVLELSATPKIGISNILVKLSGSELCDEEMIKLPIEIHNLSNSDWQHTLAATHEKLAALAKEADKLQKKENRYIRPIAVVRVQNTGRAQRERDTIHAEDAKRYLIRNLAVPENHIRIQSSEQKELAGEDLLSEYSPVRWIVTKDALKEGWDCSFAYLLALLDTTRAATTMTQMVGRVMRQPHTRRVEGHEGLNRCAIFCYNQDVSDAVAQVKTGLEKEGLTGLGDPVRGVGDGTGDLPQVVTVKRRGKYRGLNIFLPRVLHKAGHDWRLLDYDRDILGAVNWDEIDGGDAVLLDDRDIVRENRITIDLHGASEEVSADLETGERATVDYFVRRLADTVPNPWQAARIVEDFLQTHRRAEQNGKRLLHNRIYLSDILRQRIGKSLDENAEKVFRDKVGRNEIRFHLETDQPLDYELGQTIEVVAARGESTMPVQHSLFDPVHEIGFNHLEKNFALYLDGHSAIHWWHRIAARREYALQGWRRHRVYPDFVACRQKDGRLFILETKGGHLRGNEDTDYKEKLLATLEKSGHATIDRGEWHISEPPAGPLRGNTDRDRKGKWPERPGTRYHTGSQRRTRKVSESPAVFRILFEDTWKEQANTLLQTERTATNGSP